MIDAPVSGGDIGATKGTCPSCAAATKANFDRALPVMEKMGSKIVLCGDVGAGNITKLSNQSWWA
jgi:3-hydroxyisobutyrate dehydrogenase-like beta-hydroxyacid dehydrogenase